MATGTVLMVVAVLVAAAWLAKKRLTGGPRVNGIEARRLVGEGARLLDVRSRREFASGHLPDALNIPVHQLAERVSELGEPGNPVVVYCLSGARSAAACGVLRAAGYASVHDLGPMHAW